VAAGQTGLFYESVFEEMVADGSMAPAAVIFPAERWYEIDTPIDLKAAELAFPRRLHAARAWRPATVAKVARSAGAAV
jgi:hypothetical protein